MPRTTYQVTLQNEEYKPFENALKNEVEDFAVNDNYKMDGQGAYGCCTGTLKLNFSAPAGTPEALKLEEIFDHGGVMRQPGWKITKLS